MGTGGELDAHKMMTGDDTRGDVWTVDGAWSGLSCSGGAARGKFLDLYTEGRRHGRVMAGEKRNRPPTLSITHKLKSSKIQKILKN